MSQRRVGDTTTTTTTYMSTLMLTPTSPPSLYLTHTHTDTQSQQQQHLLHLYHTVTGKQQHTVPSYTHLQQQQGGGLPAKCLVLTLEVDSFLCRAERGE